VKWLLILLMIFAPIPAPKPPRPIQIEGKWTLRWQGFQEGFNVIFHPNNAYQECNEDGTTRYWGTWIMEKPDQLHVISQMGAHYYYNFNMKDSNNRRTNLVGFWSGTPTPTQYRASFVMIKK
jgi:hypothetical protein